MKRCGAEPSLKILFTSGHSENEVRHDGRLDDGVLLLAKPHRKSDLARMIRGALTADMQLHRLPEEGTAICSPIRMCRENRPLRPRSELTVSALGTGL